MDEELDGVLEIEEIPVIEESLIEPDLPKPERPRRNAAPMFIQLYHEDDGYHFVGIDAGGRVVSDTESSESYETAHMAKRDAHAAYPTLPIRGR